LPMAEAGGQPCIVPPPPGEVLIIEGRLTEDDPAYLRTTIRCEPTELRVRYDLYRFCGADGRTLTFQLRTGNDDARLTTDGLGIFGYHNDGFNPEAPLDHCLNGQAWDAGRPVNRGTSYGFAQPLHLVATGLTAATRGTYRVVVCGDRLGVPCRDPRDP